MKPRVRKLTSALALLALGALACNLSVGNSGDSSAPDVSTRVAGTVSAVWLETAAAPTPAVQPSDTPAAIPQQTAANARELRVFAVDGNHNLWMWTENGGMQSLDSTGDIYNVVPSPDGSRAAFTRTPDYLRFSLWVVNKDGSDPFQLVSSDEFSSMMTAADMAGLEPDFLTWTPDGASLAFTTSPKFPGPGYTLQDDLWVVHASSGKRRQALESGRGGALYYSPDGSKIALVQPDRISVCDSNGSNLKEIFSYKPVITYSEYAYRATPVWAPDSASLWAAIPPADPLLPGQPTSLWRIPVDGSMAARLGDIQVNFLTPVVLSKNQDRILYLSDGANPDDNITEIHIANPDGGGDSLFLTGNANPPLQWSPDGAHFNFVLDGGNQTRLGQIGGGYRTLGDTGTATQVKWIDAATFLFMNKTGTGWEIRRGTINGASSTLVSLPGDPDSYFPVYDFTN